MDEIKAIYICKCRPDKATRLLAEHVAKEVACPYCLQRICPDNGRLFVPDNVVLDTQFVMTDADFLKAVGISGGV